MRGALSSWNEIGSSTAALKYCALSLLFFSKAEVIWKNLQLKNFQIIKSPNFQINNMALTESNMLPLGTKAPDFKLPDAVFGELVSLDNYKSEKATVIMFICNHCPYVIHVNPEIVKLANEYILKGISFIAISSNDAERYPDDAPDKMKETALVEGYSFPYLYDESQDVAKAYHAACTPDFYVFDADLKLVYRGRLDNSRPKTDIQLTGNDLRAALDAVLAGKSVQEKQYPSMGCNIKWKVNI
jgi:thiol-disulfide isomerase/thioredoxin